VKVVSAKNATLLSPGQQAIVSRKDAPIVVSTADTEEAVAWKDELFMFNNMPIQTIMREIARSYDVEVEYLGAIPTERFSIMGIPRHVPVSQLLKVLALTDKVNFSIEGRKITVKKK
jgi:ferric-dicitrate binding protein FerR (iron transport regulator)